MNIRAAFLSFVFICTAISPSLAQDKDSNDKWDISLGGGVLSVPEYPGSGKYQVIPIPYVDIEYATRVFLNPMRGLGVYALNTQQYKLGASIGYEFGRDEDDDDRLNGMGDIDATAEVVLFGSYIISREVPIEFALELRQDIMDGHDGFTAKAGAEYIKRFSDGTLLKFGPDISYGSDNYMESYFGVSSSQANASRFSRYNAGAGIKDVGFNTLVVYPINGKWFATAFVNYDHLVGDAGDSPISEKDHQFFSGAFIGYKF